MYLVLHYVLKELATKRLPVDQRAFEAVSAALFDPVFAHWCEDTAALGAAVAAAAASSSPPSELETRWALELKALRRLAVFAAQSDAKSLQLNDRVCRAAPACASACDAFRPMAHASVSAERCCVRLTKCLAHMHREHPWSLFSCGALRTCVSAAITDIMAGDGDAAAAQATVLPSAPVLVRQLRLITAVLTCPAYRPPAPPGAVMAADTSAKSQQEAALKAAVGSEIHGLVLAPPRGLQLLCCLATRHLLLTSQDLASWEADGEEFHQDWMSRSTPEALGDTAAGSGGGAADDVAPGAQALLVALLGAGAALAPGLVQHLWQQATSPDSAAPPPHGGLDARDASGRRVLAVDAALHALGAGAYELHDAVDYDAWWPAVLEPCLTGLLPHQQGQGQVHPLCKALRRRAAWVVGQWVAKASPQLRPAIYARLAVLVSPRTEHDVSVRLAACAAVRLLVDDFAFDAQQFEPVAGPLLEGLFSTALSCTDADAAAQAFGAAVCCVDALGQGVRPFGAAIVGAVTPLWHSGQGHSLLRMQVLTVLTRLVCALGPDSPSAWPVVLPLLCASCDPAHPESDVLFEDAAGLWHATLRHAPAWDASLLGPLPHAVASLSRSWEHLPILCRVVNSYLLLDPGATLQATGPALAERLASAVGDVNERGLLLVLPLADAACRAFPAHAPGLLDALLAKLVRLCTENEQSNGVGEVSNSVLAGAASLLGRICVQNTPAFLALMQRASQAGLGRGDAVLAFVDGWVERQDSLLQPSKRRTLALGLCALLASGHHAGLARLDDAAAAVTGVLAEEKAALQSGDGLLDGYDPIGAADGADDAWDAAGLDIQDEGAEEARKAAALEADPVRKTDVAAAFSAALAAAAQCHGQAGVQAALARLDATVAASLRASGVAIGV